MATVELIPPPEPEKQIVITVTQVEARRLLQALGANSLYSGTIRCIADGLDRVLN